MKQLVWLIIISMTGLISCHEHNDHNDDHGHEHEHHEHRITTRENQYEFFVKYQVDETSDHIAGVLYISHNHQPVELLSGTLHLHPESADPVQTDLIMANSGVYPFEFPNRDMDGSALAVQIDHDGETVETELGRNHFHEREADHSDDIPESHHEREADRHPDEVPNAHQTRRTVVFDKEQQWELQIVTETTAVRDIPNTVAAFGSMTADPQHYREITSPVDGHIYADGQSILPSSGTRIERQDVITSISPSLSAENSWVDRRLTYQQAKEAYDRAERLLANNAISQREYQQREREYETRRAGYEQFMFEKQHQDIQMQDNGDQLSLIAARGGLVDEVFVNPGSYIGSGEVILTLFDPAYLRAELYAYRDELAGMDDIPGVEIQPPGGHTYSFEDERVTLISRDDRTDATGVRTRIILAIDNRDHELKIHQPVRAQLISKTGSDHPAVPASAIFDEDSHKVVFVQLSGDEFERRVVHTGNRYGKWTAITDGLSPGERIVTEGVYPLYLAFSNIQLEHGHDH